MGRRKKSINQFNDNLTNFSQVFEFFFKDTDKVYSHLESDLNVRLEYISKQLNKWKRDQLTLIDELDEIYNQYRIKFKSSVLKTTIISRLLMFIHSHLMTLGFKTLHPRLNEIIPHELQHTHYDGQAVVSVKPTTLHYRLLLQEAIDNGKPIKKVSRRKDSILPQDFTCQHCQAPIDYLYLNTPNQVLCKCCNLTSSIDRVRYPNPDHHHNNRCPHCNYKLDVRKDRSGYTVLRCSNKKCSFFLKNKETAHKIINKFPELNLTLHHFKLHYTFRNYNFNVELLKNAPIDNQSFNSLNRYNYFTKKLNIFNQDIFLLCLAYRHNYSISKSKIASILTELHHMPISSQTVDNYLDLMAEVLRPYVENYPYKVSQKIVADETYIKIEGKQYYLYRYFDYKTNIIISQYLSESRDTIATYNSMNQCLTTIKDTVDLTNLTLVVDGYTPYQIVANDLNNNYDGQFNIKVIPLIGLKNHRIEHLPYVPDKQAIERNHRDFKVAYHNSTNFRSVDAALNYCTLQQAVHNFITKFRKTDKIPVKIPTLMHNDGVIDRWEKLIFESINYINKSNKVA